MTYEGTLICCVWNHSLIPSYEYHMAPKVTALMSILAAMQSAQWCVQCLCLSWQGNEKGVRGFDTPRDWYHQSHWNACPQNITIFPSYCVVRLQLKRFFLFIRLSTCNRSKWKIFQYLLKSNLRTFSTLKLSWWQSCESRKVCWRLCFLDWYVSHPITASCCCCRKAEKYFNIDISIVFNTARH